MQGQTNRSTPGRHGSMQKGPDLMVSVRLGRIASTIVGDRQVRVSLLSILYCASLIRSCSRCSSTYNTMLVIECKCCPFWGEFPEAFV